MSKRIRTSIIALLLSVCMTFTVFGAVDFNFYGNAYSDLRAAYGGNEEALSQHYQVFGEKEGRATSVADAVAKGNYTAIITYFLALTMNEFQAHGLEADFKFFNAAKYIEANPDVKAAVGDNFAAALNHYLTFGVYEGRSSQTEFDPIIAVVNHPECLDLMVSAASAESPTPKLDTLLTAWTQKTGQSTTAGYGLNIVDGKVVGPKVAGGNSGNSSGSTQVNKLTHGFLIYLCGTDLETKTYHEASGVLFELICGLRENPDVEVMICAGGTEKWGNAYMNSMQAANGAKTTVIYRIDNSKISEAYDKLIQKYNISEYDSSKTDMLDMLVNADILVPVKVYETGYGMSNPNTLKEFLNVADETLGADSYSISFWDHGGGITGGFCNPAVPQGSDETALPVRGAQEAIASSAITQFAFMGFDMCLMGGLEVAEILKDNYIYLYASEEVMRGNFDYPGLLDAISNNLTKTDEDIAFAEAYASITGRYYNGSKGTADGTIVSATFYSNRISSATAAVNDFGKELMSAVNIGDAYAKLVYAAIKNARLKCEILSAGEYTAAAEFVDGNQFLCILKNELIAAANGLNTGAQEETDFKAVIENLTGKDGALEYAAETIRQLPEIFCYCYNNQQIYFHDWAIGEERTDGLDYWEALKGDLVLTGTSLYVPYNMGCLGYDTDAQRHTSDGKYKNIMGSTLPDYVNLISGYHSFVLSQEESDRKTNLAEALTNANGCKGYKDLLDLSWTKLDDKAVAMEVKINDYAVGDYISVHSSGDAFVDVIETFGYMYAYILRHTGVSAMTITGAVTETFTPRQEDIVVAYGVLKYENLAAGKSAIEIPIEYLRDNINFNVLEGEGTLGESTGTFRDYIMPSKLSAYAGDVDDMRKALETADGKEYTGEIFAASGKVNTITTGTADYTDLNVQHLFEKNSSGEYVYIGSVSYTTNDKGQYVFSKINNIKTISFYHQVIRNGSLVDVETERSSSDDEHAAYRDEVSNAPTYDVSDIEHNPLVIKTVSNYYVQDTDNNQYNFGFSTSSSNYHTSVTDGIYGGDMNTGDGSGETTYNSGADMYETLKDIDNSIIIPDDELSESNIETTPVEIVPVEATPVDETPESTSEDEAA